MQYKTIYVAISAGIFFSYSTLSWAHSPMFPDYFKFDPSNGGEGPPLTATNESGFALTTACVGGFAGEYPCNNIDLESFVPRNQLGNGSNLNDIWGWTDPQTGQEIAIVGQTDGTSFVDISNPSSPIVLGFLPTADGSASWRDMKVYSNHAFIVADGSGNRDHGMQVFDLTQLRGVTSPRNFSATARETGFGSAHNIAINEDTGFAYVVGSDTCSGGLYMVDISSPTNPSFAGCFSVDGYTHDTQCVVYQGPDSRYTNREICMAYNEDTVTIVDVTNKSNPVQVSRTPYSGSRYTHQGWFVDDNHETILVNDELDEQQSGVPTSTYIFDVSNLESPNLIGVYRASSSAVDHNLYARDGFVYEANYRSGLRILSTSNANQGQLTEVAFFDTIPNSDSAQFSGLWSSYIDFDSGNIIMSDIGEGLFIVSPNLGDTNPGPDPGPDPDPDPPSGDDCIPGAIDLSNTVDYSSSNSGSVSVSSDGCTIALSGNIWQATSEEFTIGADTVVSFDFSSNGSGEIQGLGFDEDLTASEDRIFKLTGTQTWGLTNFNYTGNGATQRITIPVGQFFTGTMALVIANDNDAGSGNTVTVGNVVVESGSPSDGGEECIEETFESGAGGWTNQSDATCSTGAFVTGSPTAQSDGVQTQVGTASDGDSALFTAANTSAGSNDVDGGTCIAESPVYSVTEAATLAFDYFHGQRDAGDDAGDFFRVDVSTNGGSTFQTVVSAGDVSSEAAWTSSGNISIGAGSDVVMRILCADGAATGDLVECGLDNVRICVN